MPTATHLTLAAAGLAALLTAAPASAGYTFIKNNRNGEPAIPQILDASFGTSVTEDGLDFVDDGIRFRRLDDDTEDQQWPAGSYEAIAEAKYTSQPISFGYAVVEAGAASFRPLFDVRGQGDDAFGFGAVSGDMDFLFAQQVGGDLHTSVPSLNPDINGGRDHLVTYAVEDEQAADDGSRSFMLFWEDLIDDGTLNNGRSKDDFNDLAVLLTFRPTGDGPSAAPTQAVPLPAGAWGGLGLIAGLAIWRRVRG